MLKKIENSIILILLFFALYCALITGSSLDEGFEMTRGNERLKYLFSGLSLENYWTSQFDEFYPGFYDTFAIFITKMFPKKISVEIFHLTNSIFSILTVFGAYKITSILFNKDVGKIVFIICFLNPSLFGHMAINSKDTIVAFANVWTTYILLRYIKKQNLNDSSTNYVILAGLTIGLGTGVRIPFAATLIPLFFFIIIEILFLKKITSNKFSFTKFFQHSFVVLLIAYLITVSCWPQVHGNIFTEPLNLFLTQMKSIPYGVPWTLFNGNIYDTNNLPFYYIPISFFYRSPEFILISYAIFIYLLICKIDFFKKKFKSFLPKIFLLLFIILLPTLIYLVSPYRIYDGIRLFLNIIPYLCIIPGLAIYYLFINIKAKKNKFLSGIILVFFVYYLKIFVSLTPYQYTYLNLFSGNFSNAYKKFENDYWAISTKELIKKISLEENLNLKNQKITLAFCGVAHDFSRRELDKINNFKYEQVGIDEKNIDYVLMTNRVVSQKNGDSIRNVKTCFDKIKGEDIVSVYRNGLLLSTLRKKY
tara:strand:- start:16095 stop:17696 length:1602 start_codon:yes stop_codon:yes gene_type:complete